MFGPLFQTSRSEVVLNFSNTHYCILGSVTAGVILRWTSCFTVYALKIQSADTVFYYSKDDLFSLTLHFFFFFPIYAYFLNKSSPGDEIPERDVTYHLICLLIYH